MGMTVAHAQCWELLSHFEAKQTWFTRAPASVSRGVRLAQMLGLDSIDGGSGASRTVLPPARDWTELEERRRTMWSIFCTDLDTSSTTGWPMLLKTDKVRWAMMSRYEAQASVLTFPNRSIHCSQLRTRASWRAMKKSPCL